MIAIVFAVLLYRLAVAGALYRAVQNLQGGPSAADFVVLLTGSLIQLVGILVMNKVEHTTITCSIFDTNDTALCGHARGVNNDQRFCRLAASEIIS